MARAISGCGKIGLELGAVKYQRYLSQRLANARALARRERGIYARRAQMNEADLISSSFGQEPFGYGTPDGAQAYAALANEGCSLETLGSFSPTVMWAEGPAIFPRTTTQEVLSMMRGVVDGHGQALPPSPASTSPWARPGILAQKAFRGKYGGERTCVVQNRAAEKPPISVVILLTNRPKVKYGGVIAARCSSRDRGSPAYRGCCG